MDFYEILIDTLYLLALINPISKISILAVISPLNRDELAQVVRRSSLIAGGMLIAIMLSGNFVLVRIFHVKLESLMVAGGFVLSWVGFHALRKGMFYEKETHARFTELAIVPLACPMIAGPATIAATIALVSQREQHLTVACAIMLAVAINGVLMRFSRQIAFVLRRFNILGALIRITGLIVMTIGVQMVLDGLAKSLFTAQPPLP